MATNIKCPSCNFEFPLEEALNDELKESIEKEKNELRHQMIDFKKTKEEA
jgi:thiol-disulfide isomerase/thioredoxin